MARPFIPVPGTLKAELLFSQKGQRLENVLHIDTGHTPVLSDVVSLAGAIITWWTTYIQPIAATELALMGVKFTNLEAADGFQVEYNAGLPLYGTAGATGLPNNVTVAVRLTTDYRGRNSTGRLYHVGLRAGQISGNLIDATVIPVLKTAYEALVSACLDGGGSLSVVSYWINKVLRPEGLATPITGVAIDENLDSQRRRLTSRGK